MSIQEKNTNWKENDQNSFQIVKNELSTVDQDIKIETDSNPLSPQSASGLVVHRASWAVFHCFDYLEGGAWSPTGVPFELLLLSNDKITGSVYRHTLFTNWDRNDVESDVLSDLTAYNKLWFEFDASPVLFQEEIRAYQVVCHGMNTEWVWKYSWFHYYTIDQDDIYSCWFKDDHGGIGIDESHTPRMAINIYTCGGIKSTTYPDNIVYGFLVPKPGFTVSDMAFGVTSTYENGLTMGDFGGIKADTVILTFWDALTELGVSLSGSCSAFVAMHNTLFVPGGAPSLNYFYGSYNYIDYERASSPIGISHHNVEYWDNWYTDDPVFP